MKKLKIFFTVALFALSITIYAQDTPPPPPEDKGSAGNAPRGTTGSAPIGGGTAILFTLALFYGAKKYYSAKKIDLDQ